MSEADFSLASLDLGHSKSSRAAAPLFLRKQLQSVSLTRNLPDLFGDDEFNPNVHDA